MKYSSVYGIHMSSVVWHIERVGCAESIERWRRNCVFCLCELILYANTVYDLLFIHFIVIYDFCLLSFRMNVCVCV